MKAIKGHVLAKPHPYTSFSCVAARIT